MSKKKTKQAPNPAAAGFGRVITSEQIARPLVLRMEQLTQRYSRDIPSVEMAKRLQGIAHTCLMLNAYACASQPLRLYRKEGTRAVSKAGTRAVPRRVKESLYKGTMGTKAQNFVASGADVVEVMDHEALRFIRRRNPLWPGPMMDTARFYCKLGLGNYYAVYTGEGQDTLEWPGFPQFTLPVFDKYNFIQGYYFGRASEDTIAISPDQVSHYRNGMGRNNPLIGESDLIGVVPDIDLVCKTLIHDIAVAENGQVPPGMVSIKSPTPVTQQQIESLFDSLEEWQVGGRREGQPFVGQNIEWIPLNFKPSELKTLEQVHEYEKRIRFACQIPESMADSNASTYASANVADAQHGRWIRSKLIIDAGEQTEYVLTRFGLDPEQYCLVYDDPVPRDEAAEINRLSTMLRDGTLTANEYRAEIGYDQVEDPMADRLLINGQPLGGFAGMLGSVSDRSGSAAPAASQQTTDADGNPVEAEAIQDTALNGAQIAQLVELARLVGTGEITLAAARAIATAAFPAITPEKIDAIFQSLREGEGKPDPDPDSTPPGSPPPGNDADPEDTKALGQAVGVEGPRLVDWAMAAESERWSPSDCDCCKGKGEEFAPGIVRDIWERQGPGFVRDLEALLAAAQAENIRAFFDGKVPDMTSTREQAERIVSAEIERITGQALAAEVRAMGRALPDDIFRMVDQAARDYARTYSIRLVNDVMGATAEIAKAAVDKGMEMGLSIREIQAEMAGVPAYRAEMIARTETSRAANGSRYEAAKTLGANGNIWLTSPGHSEAHGILSSRSPKAMGEAYAMAGETIAGETFRQPIYAPPARPNCRCTMIFTYPEADE